MFYLMLLFWRTSLLSQLFVNASKMLPVLESIYAANLISFQLARYN